MNTMPAYNHRCGCGGIFEQKVRYRNEQAEIWYVCPFCGEKRPAKTAAQVQAETEERVLTQG